MKSYERFLNYVVVDTQSDGNSPTCPSTMKQKNLGELLEKELKEIGALNVEMDENGYVYGTIPAGKGSENRPVLALVAHMDTAGEVSGANVKPRIIENWDGKDIVLNEELGIVTRVEDFPSMLRYKGEDLIVTDGTTLLGADDKAGIAGIMTVAEKLIQHPELPHPEVRVIFNPDEEIGRGVEKINMDKVNATYGYTVDGGAVEGLCYECFNATSAVVTIKGSAVHPGASFGVMKNAILMGMEFHNMLPVFENPAATKDRMGFYHMVGMKGEVGEAKLTYILRDHDESKLEVKKQLMRDAADFMNKKYGEGTVDVQLIDSYRNMITKILPDHEDIIDNARAALLDMGITPVEEPARGGTDGATLSYMGMPCPNLGTGGGAAHSVHEYITIQQMDLVAELIERMVAKFA